MAQNLIKANAEAVLPNRPTIVKYVAGLEGGVELHYPFNVAPEDGVFHAGHPVAMTDEGKWEMAIINRETGRYEDFFDGTPFRGFGVLAHDVPASTTDSRGQFNVIGAVMLIGVVNTDADERFFNYAGINERHNGIVLYGKNVTMD